MSMDADNHNHRPVSFLNAARRIDPTRTLALRNRFVADMTRRFKALRRDIIVSIVARDAFGLKQNKPRIFEAATPLQFDVPSSTQKIEAFMKWLREQQSLGVLEIIERPTSILSPAQTEPWANLYLRSAYEKGVISADAKLVRAGINPVKPVSSPGARIVGIFDQPQHADRAATIFTRAFSDLAGITEAMDAQISRILSEGLLYGGGPEQLAKEIADRVDKIGLTRARTLARTEIVRTHHLATVAEYRSAGVNEVTVLAEWSTAGDDRVCEECEALEGKIFTLDEIESMIPLHPACRCVALPHIPGVLEAEKKKDEEDEN